MPATCRAFAQCPGLRPRHPPGVRIPQEWAVPLLEAQQRSWPLESFLSHFAGMGRESVHLTGCTLATGPLLPVDLSRVRSTYHLCCRCWEAPPPALYEDFEALTALLDEAARLGELGDELVFRLEVVDLQVSRSPLGYRSWALLTRVEQQLEKIRSLGVAGDLVEAAEGLSSEVSGLAGEFRRHCEDLGTSLLEEEVLAYPSEPILRLVQPSRTGEAVAAAWGTPVLVGKWLLAAAPGMPAVRTLTVPVKVPGDLTAVAQVAGSLHSEAVRGNPFRDPVEAVKAATLLV